MKRDQLEKAVQLALSKADLDVADLAIFDGFGLAGFKPVTVTTRALAMLIRWQCVQFNGQISAEALDEIATLGRTRFSVVDVGQFAPPANVRPCHSIHCRHYDLADGMLCEVEYARRQAAQARKAVASC
jgi:hypothetical protein